MRFDMRTLELFTYVNLYGRVRRIASVIRRPELDVARELAQLVQQKFLMVIPQMEMAQRSNNQKGNKQRQKSPASRTRRETAPGEL